MKFLKFLGKLLLVALLTIVTQIGGIVFLVTSLFYKRSKLKQFILFISLYILNTFLIVPFAAPYFGREKLNTSNKIVIHNFFTTITNRNYVVPEVNQILQKASDRLTDNYPNIQIHCLDANFPFWDGFPLLPHLSHNDGKKLDISLVYQNENKEITNEKPSRSGYGVFEEPFEKEYNQIAVCKSKGYWQYDFPKYLTFGTKDSELKMATNATRELVRALVAQSEVSKVFIEPHLRDRMKITHPKLRYHGCRAVRHDDHIHLQVN